MAKALTAIPLFLSCILGSVYAQTQGPGKPSCKSVPSSNGWPSPETWAALNQTIGGRLLQPVPPGAVCHPGQASFNAAQCPVTQAQWYTENLHSDDPVSVQWNNWNNDTCLPDPRLTCSPAGYPVYVINATTPEHVKAGVGFGMSFHPKPNSHSFK